MGKENTIYVIAVVTVVVGAMMVSFSQEEWRVCDTSRGEPFIPIFYIIDIDSTKVWRDTEVWDFAKTNESNLNTPGWAEMLKGAVDENNTFYENCSNNCERRIAKDIYINKGKRFMCLPSFKILGTFQNYVPIPSGVDCSQYDKDKEKCKSNASCFWREWESGICRAKDGGIGEPLADPQYCAREYANSGICPKGCIFNSSDEECKSAYCRDLVREEYCNEFQDKCVWEKLTYSQCEKLASCAQIKEPEHCNRIISCTFENGYCVKKKASYTDFLLYQYNKIFEMLPDNKKINLVSSFYCNVVKLDKLDYYPPYYLRLIYDDGGCGAQGCADPEGYNTYYKVGPTIGKWLVGHEVGHNAGLDHYWFAKEDSATRWGGNFGAEILLYLLEDFPTKFYGRSKDTFDNPGKYGTFYKINEKIISDTLDDEKHIQYDKLKTFVYNIEECAQKNNMPYKASNPIVFPGQGGISLPSQKEFEEFKGYTDEECKRNDRCKSFVEKALEYYKYYLQRLPDIIAPPCNSYKKCVYEPCFVGEDAAFDNYMDYYLAGCHKECKFTSYQIYQRGEGNNRPGNVQEWIYMSLYNREYDSQKNRYYFDITKTEGAGGAYGLKQEVIRIFKEMASEAGLKDYAVPVFEEKGENTVDIEFFRWLTDKKGNLIQTAHQMLFSGELVCPPGYPEMNDIINTFIRHLKYKLTQPPPTE